MSRAIGACAQLALAALVGSVAGASVLGGLFVYLSWNRIGARLLGFGLPQYLLRESSTSSSAVAGPRTGRLAVRLGLIGLLLTVSTASAAILADRERILPLVLAAGIGATGQVLLTAGSMTLKGYGRPSSAFLVEFALVPTATASLILAAEIRTTATIMLVHAVCSLTFGVTLIVLIWFDRIGRAAELEVRTDTALSVGPSRSEVLGFGTVALADVILTFSPILLLAAFVDTESVAAFAVAQRIVGVAVLILLALDGHFAPRFASAYVAGDRHLLDQYRRRAQVLSLAFYLPLCLLFFAAPNWLTDAFGGDLPRVGTLLAILALGQVVNAATGLCASLLLMTAREKELSVVLAAAVCLYIPISLLTSHSGGTAGMAWTVAGTLAIISLASWHLARQVTQGSDEVRWSESEPA